MSGTSFLGLLHPFLTVGRGAHDLDVGLEGEQLLEVIQGARDVVHDQDFDLLAHAVISLKKAPREIFRFRGVPVNVFFQLSGLVRQVVGLDEALVGVGAVSASGNIVVLTDLRTNL